MATQRVRPEIIFLSPAKNEYRAKWTGDTRSSTSRVSKYAYPFITGETALFFGASSWTYDMTIIFDGDGYERTTEQFVQELRKVGEGQYSKWKVKHPTKGFMILQPLNVTEQDDPIKNANGISVSITWIEPIDPELLKTGAELQVLAGHAINEFNIQATDRFTNVKQKSFFDKISIKKGVDKVSELSDKTVGKLANLNQQVFAKQLEIQSGLQSMLNDSVVKTLEVGALTIQNITNPLYAIRSAGRRLRALGDLALAIAHEIDKPESETTYNTAHVNELALSGVMQGTAQTAITSDYASKDEAIAMLNNIETLQAMLSKYLDQAQTATENNLVGDQYFAQGDAYQAMLTMVAAVKAYLTAEIYNLKSTKIAVLPKSMTVAEAVITYYGSMDYYQLFTTSNNLTGDELIYLPAGKEVVIYE